MSFASLRNADFINLILSGQLWKVEGDYYIRDRELM